MSLFQDIINMPMKPPAEIDPGSESLAWVGYRIGHVDARHAAAELALKADATIAELLGALKAMMEGSVYKDIQGDTDWHSIAMPKRSALEKARLAIQSAEGTKP